MGKIQPFLNYTASQAERKWVFVSLVLAYQVSGKLR